MAFTAVWLCPGSSAGKAQISVDDGGDSQTLTEVWFAALDSLGADFDRQMSDRGLKYVLNLKLANALQHCIDAEGWDWYQGPDGTHRWNFKPSVLLVVGASESCLGVLYDEPEHTQIDNNWVWVSGQRLRLPFLLDARPLSLSQCFLATVDAIRRLVRFYDQASVPRVLTEHVFPIMFHNFACGGAVLSPKILKETYTPVVTATALGASLQDNAPELWTTPNLWQYGDYPGHSAVELFSALKFMYWIGVDRVYVENMNCQNLRQGLVWFDSQNRVHVGDGGRVVQRLVGEYVVGCNRFWVHLTRCALCMATER